MSAAGGRLPWEGNGPCGDCGGRNIVWNTAHELWETVMDCVPTVRRTASNQWVP